MPGDKYKFNVAVSNGSKILKWKQITTHPYLCSVFSCCFQWFKDTKMKANHNRLKCLSSKGTAVSNGSKILKWKQITTYPMKPKDLLCCFQWFKDTKMKANHNFLEEVWLSSSAVSNGSKILKWKQITTDEWWFCWNCSCFQWFKDTKMKANHNRIKSLSSKGTLFPMVQRY